MLGFLGQRKLFEVPEYYWGISGSSRKSASSKRGRSVASKSKKKSSNTRSASQQSALSKAYSSHKSSGVGTAKVSRSTSTSPNRQLTQTMSQVQRVPSAGTFVTDSGPVSIARDGKGISPQSDEGKTIQAIYNRQSITKKINQQQKAMTERMRQADSAKEALKIRSEAIKKNPALENYTKIIKKGKVIETRGILGVPQGDDFFKSMQSANVKKASPKPATKTPKFTSTFGVSSFNFFSTPTKTKTDSGDWLTDDQKAFGFFPDLPKGDDFLSKAGRGAIKGSSNVLASFFNLGTLGQVGLEKALGQKSVVKDSDWVGYYSTPVTNVETGFFDAAKGSVVGAVEGKKYDAGKRIQTGFAEAGQNFFGKPVESAFSLVEAVPYLGFGAAKGAGKMIGNFFKPTKTVSKGGVDDFFKVTSKVDSRGLDKSTVFDFDTASGSFFKSNKIDLGLGVTKGDSGVGKFFGTSTKAKDDYWKFTDKGKKTKGGGTYEKKSWSDDFFGGGKQTKSGSQVLIQKQKTKLKNGQATKSKMFDGFFKVKQTPKVKQKAKVKQKQVAKQQQFFKPLAKQKSKQKITPFFKVKQTPKVKGANVPKLKQTGKQKTRLRTPTKTKTGIVPVIPPLMTGAGMAGGIIPFFGAKRRARKAQRVRGGKKSYTAWNVDEGKVGGFFKGPSHKTGKTTGVFREFNRKQTKPKKVKDIYSNFF